MLLKQLLRGKWVRRSRLGVFEALIAKEGGRPGHLELESSWSRPACSR